MNLEIVERGGVFQVCYDDQIVGHVLLGTIHKWEFKQWVHSWDYFNPKYVKLLLKMVDDKVLMLNLTKRLLK